MKIRRLGLLLFFCCYTLNGQQAVVQCLTNRQIWTQLSKS
jgi:hypothetical protein